MSYIQFDPSTEIVVSSEQVTAGLWGTGNYLFSGSFTTSSVQETSAGGKFYLNVYQTSSTSTTPDPQFSIAYGNNFGSSSAAFNPLVDGNSPSANIYNQMFNLIYDIETGSFNFGGVNGISNDIFVISINRSKYKESVNPGTWNLNLTSGSNRLTLTDDSNSNSVTSFIGATEVYNIVSGSNGNSYNSSSFQTTSGSYGIFLPAMGLFILNARALALPAVSGGLAMTIDQTSALNYTSSYPTTPSANNRALYNIISGSYGFSANSLESISSTYFFVNAMSTEFNYTTNPSVVDSNGNIIYPTLVNNPQTFVTTVGLYNDSNELLAVAKLSKPLAKDFTKQLSLRVKLEF